MLPIKVGSVMRRDGKFYVCVSSTGVRRQGWYKNASQSTDWRSITEAEFDAKLAAGAKDVTPKDATQSL